MTDRPDIPERFSVRLTEAHAGATVVLKTSPDGSMVRYSDYEKARKQGAEEERERLREVVADLRARRESARAEERRRVLNGMNGAGPHSAMRAYDDAVQRVCAALDTPAPSEPREES